MLSANHHSQILQPTASVKKFEVQNLIIVSVIYIVFIMKTYCIVRNCNSNSEKDSQLSFYKFPPNYDKFWAKLVNRPFDWMPRPGTRICSLHFLPTDITDGNVVRPGTIPFSQSERKNKIHLMDHNYACQEEIPASKVKDLQKTVQILESKVRYSDQRKRKLKNEINSLQEALNEVKSELTEKDFAGLSEKASTIPDELFAVWSKRKKVIDPENPTQTYRPGVAYTEALRQFALSLHNVSPSAYR